LPFQNSWSIIGQIGIPKQKSLGNLFDLTKLAEQAVRVSHVPVLGDQAVLDTEKVAHGSLLSFQDTGQWT